MLGVKFGSQPLPGGGIEYIIQVDPLSLDTLRSGADIYSDIPPELRDVRSFRITMASDRPGTTGLSAFSSLSPTGGSASVARPQGSSVGLLQQGSVVPPILPTQPAQGQAPGTRFPAAPAGSVPLPKVEVSRGASGLASGLPATAGSAKDATSTGAKKPSLSPAAEMKPKEKAKPEETRRPEVESKPEAAILPAEPKPLPGLTAALAATTAGSLGGMFFFGWVAHDYRKRYRALLSRCVGSASGELVRPTGKQAP